MRDRRRPMERKRESEEGRESGTERKNPKTTTRYQNDKNILTITSDSTIKRS